MTFFKAECSTAVDVLEKERLELLDAYIETAALDAA